MSRRPRCFTCGRGLSRKHRATPEVRRLLALFGRPSLVCIDCGMRRLAKDRPA